MKSFAEHNKHWCEIVHKDDIKSGADSKGNKVYEDRHIPEFSPKLKTKDGKPAPLAKYLAIHEEVEEKAMKEGMPYLRAHTTRATPAERAAVEADGVSWKEYTAEINGYLAHVEHEKMDKGDKPPKKLHVNPNAAVRESVRRIDQLITAESAEDPHREFGEHLSKKYNAKVRLYGHLNQIRLDDLEVPRANRKQGIGSAILGDITRHADEHQKRVTLTPGLKDPRHGTTSRSRLVKFYKRNGFTLNSGNKTDFTMRSGDMYYNPRRPKNEALDESYQMVRKVQGALDDNLRRSPWKGSDNCMAGHCYVASEALYHLMGGQQSGYKPMHISHEGSPHWFLQHEKTGKVLDPTAGQFKTQVPYHKAKGKGFLTKEPSKRAQTVMNRVKNEALDDIPEVGPEWFNEATLKKATKEAAHYRKGTPNKQCELCTMFRAPHGCTAVEGEISEHGLCDYFKRKGRKTFKQHINEDDVRPEDAYRNPADQ